MPRVAVCLSIDLSIHLSISTYLSLDQSIYLSIYPCISILVYPSIDPSHPIPSHPIHPSIHPHHANVASMFVQAACYELNRAAAGLAKQAVAEARSWLRSRSFQSKGGTERLFQAVSQSPQQLKFAAGVLGPSVGGISGRSPSCAPTNPCWDLTISLLVPSRFLEASARPPPGTNWCSPTARRLAGITQT